MEPFGDVHVYAADMTAPLLMVFEPDGGWSHAEPVTIYTPSAEKRSMLSEAAESGKELIRSRSVRPPQAHALPLSHHTHGRVQVRASHSLCGVSHQHPHTLKDRAARASRALSKTDVVILRLVPAP